MVLFVSVFILNVCGFFAYCFEGKMRVGFGKVIYECARCRREEKGGAAFKKPKLGLLRKNGQ
jgi:hypothetical protein